MNIFFTRKYNYKVYDSIENVRVNIESIIKRKWFDFSINISGRIKDENSFILNNKWWLVSIRWIEVKPAYLEGTLIQEGNKTIIDSILRPNSLFVIIFYLMLIFFLLTLFGVEIFKSGAKEIQLLLFSLFSLIMYGFIQLYTIGLRNRFERLLGLHRYK